MSVCNAGQGARNIWLINVCSQTTLENKSISHSQMLFSSGLFVAKYNTNNSFALILENTRGTSRTNIFPNYYYILVCM